MKRYENLAHHWDVDAEKRAEFRTWQAGSKAIAKGKRGLET